VCGTDVIEVGELAGGFGFTGVACATVTRPGGAAFPGGCDDGMAAAEFDWGFCA
jgi:hypothetical protein